MLYAHFYPAPKVVALQTRLSYMQLNSCRAIYKFDHVNKMNTCAVFFHIEC